MKGMDGDGGMVMRKSLKREYTIDRGYDFEDRNSQYAKKRAHKRERKRIKFLLHLRCKVG